MKPDPSKIVFGMSEEYDRKSMEIFLQLAGRPEFAAEFAQRLSSEEINALADHFMKLLRTHLNENEYHQLFLHHPRGQKT
jgi:hypothetical protein